MTKGFIIPSNPADLKRIKDAVTEASNCLVRIDGERDELKTIADVMAEELDVPKAVFNKMVKVYHKASFDAEVAKNEDFQAFYETIMK